MLSKIKFLNSSEEQFRKIYFFGLIFLLLLLAVFLWNYGTVIILGHDDFAYHTAVAEGFARAKGVVTWDFWESLPLGRPHNYPPLMHVVMAFFIQAGFSVVNSAKLILEFILVGGLAIFSFGLAKLFNIRTAFWSVFLITLWSSFLRMSSTVLPSTLVLFCSPAILYFALSKRWVQLGAISVLVFYTHLFMPYFIFLALMIYMLIFARKLFGPAIVTISCSFILYLPWLTHVFYSGLSYIKYFDSGSSYRVENTNPRMNILLAILSILGTISIWLKRREKEYQPGLFFIILLIVLLPISFISTNRTFNGHCLMLMGILSTFALPLLFRKRFVKYGIIIVLVVYFWVTPYSAKLDGRNVVRLSPTFVNALFSTHFRAQKIPEQKYGYAFQVIKNNSSRGESLESAMWEFDDNFYLKVSQVSAGLFFAGNSGRPVLNLRQPELNRRDDPDLQKARIVLLSVPKEQLDEQYFTNIGLKNKEKNIMDNFTLVSDQSWSDTNKVYIYKNSSDNIIKESMPGFKFPLWLAYLTLFALFFVLFTASMWRLNFGICKRKKPWY